MAWTWSRAAALAAAFFSCALSAPALACDAPTGASRLESSRYVVFYRTTPPRIQASRHFTMELTVCAKSGAPLPEAVRVDATMPAHGHGMNYRVDVAARGGGRFEAKGFMFHMPGRWELVFEVRGGNTWDRLTHEIVL